MTKITGGCQCGAVRFTTSAPPSDVHYCHCGMCRRAVGNVFATLAWFKTDEVRWTAGHLAEHRSSTIAVRGFCAGCGTPLFLRYDGADDIALMLGALDEPERFPASHHYGSEGRLHWVDIGRDLPAKPTGAHLSARTASSRKPG